MSLFRLSDEPDGFSVERLCGRRLTVQLQPWAFVLLRDGHAPERCTFYDGDRLTLLVAARLLGRDDAFAPDVPLLPPLASAAREARLLRTEVGLKRLRLLAQVDPAVHEIQLSALRLAGHVPPLAQEAALYQEPFIVRDIRTYPAAAVAFAFLQPALWPPSGDAAAPDESPADPPSVAEQLRAMADWRGLFSPDGAPYRSLNRTLMNLPADVPPELLCGLRRVRLERPVTDRLELLTVLVYADTLGAGRGIDARGPFRSLHHATAADVRAALARVGDVTGRKLHGARLDDVRYFIRYLADYPEPFRGPLSGLVERVVDWHRQVCERERVEELVRSLGGADRRVVAPRIPLPAVPGIEFLGTVGAIVEEGVRMGHCIATRAQDALLGRCFLFHVDHRGEQGSVEVSPRGSISEAQGPHNTDNPAVWWGAMQLRNWAAGLAPPPRRHSRRPDPNQLALPF